ncbi:MAG TPA: RidA family protein [Dongiaceae bacterium]
MTRTIIATANAPKTPPQYSQAVVAAGLVFVSGDPEQTAQRLRNISAILEAAGTSLKHAVQATFILVHEQDFAGLNEEWLKWFPDKPPARQGAKLPVSPPGLRVSIAMIAAMPA